jgi:hypothetical protein
VAKANGAAVPTAPNSLKQTADQAIALLARGAARSAVRLAVFAIVALWATWPLLSSAGSLNGYRDSHPLVQYEESARRTIVEFGQLPLWDPYYCGGMDGLGTPQSRFASPTFLLTLVFGTLRAEPMVAFFMILLGLEGAYRYARSRGATNLGASLAAPMFALSGIFAVAPALGWYNFFGFELLPWAAFGLRRAFAGSRAGLAICAGALAWMVGFGGTYPAPLAALWCAFEVIDWVVVHRRDRPKLLLAIGMGSATAALAIGLSAVKLWPVAQTLEMAPRIIGGTPGMSPTSVLRAILGRIHPDEHGDFSVTGTFLVGGFTALAVGAGIGRRRSISLLLMGSAAVWLAAGFAAKVSLFAALKQLPLYSTLRYPERFLILFALAASTVAALGIGRLQVIARKRTIGTLLLTVAVGLLLANLGPLVANHHAAAKGRPMVAPPTNSPGEFRQARGTRWALAYYGPMQKGCLSCYDAYPVPQSPLLRGDLPAEEYFEDPAAGTVIRKRWTPNEIELEVDAVRPARLLVNQNWHPGWHASEGTITSVRNLLAVDLPPGKRNVTLRFRPRPAIGGFFITLVALVALVWLVRRERRDKRAPWASSVNAKEIALAALAPAIPFALVMTFMNDAPIPKVELRTATGEDVVAASVPESARLVNAHFTSGVTLVAFRQSSAQPAPESVLTLELDWKVDPNVDPKTGIFVHLVPSSGEDLRADHVMVSDVLELEHAPPGKILRDVVEITIPHDAGGKMWTVYAGLWRVRGNGKRVPIDVSGTSRVADDRVQIGSFYVP